MNKCSGEAIYTMLIGIALMVGLWNMSLLYFLVLAIYIMIGFSVLRRRSDTVSIPIMIVPFLLLLVYEGINFYFSAYPRNSILFLREFTLVSYCIFLLFKLFRDGQSTIYFVIVISLSASLLALLNIPIFFFRYYESNIYGFTDFSQFRFLYSPFGFLSNEWVTILLCFLPFPIIGLILFWNKPLFRYGFLLSVGFIVFSILISFSRAGFLALFLFVVLVESLCCYYRVCSMKKVIITDICIFVFLSLFVYSFSDTTEASVHQTNSHKRSTYGRVAQWESILFSEKDYPFWGVGAKNYALVGRQSNERNLENTFSGRVNNSYIQLLIEKGWIGLLLWICVIGIFIFDTLKRIRKPQSVKDRFIEIILFSAVTTIMFREFFFSSLFYNSGILLLFFILLIFKKKKNESAIRIKKNMLLTGGVVGICFSTLIYINEPDDALLNAEKGLKCERVSSVREAIRYYRQACSLSPFDALFLHNLGQLYEINHQQDSALFYISKAVEVEPNVALYQISKGLIIELQTPERAFECYKQAILISPDIIDSPFFYNLRVKHAERTKKLLRDSYTELAKMQSVRYSSVVEAKIGKLLLSLGETEQAYEALVHVTKIHPNLNRPWYYLGLIEQRRGKENVLQDVWKKSCYLSPTDHLPMYALVSYYETIGDTIKSNSYRKAAERAWEKKRSVHSARCERVYYKRCEDDDVIPQGFLDYITPIFSSQIHDTN